MREEEMDLRFLGTAEHSIRKRKRKSLCCPLLSSRTPHGSHRSKGGVTSLWHRGDIAVEAAAPGGR